MYAEELTEEGWQPAYAPGRYGAFEELYEFGRFHLITYLLSGFEARSVRGGERPPPILRRSRGCPMDLSPEVQSKLMPMKDCAGPITWVTPAEILAYDWHPVLEDHPWLAEFLDRVAALQPPDRIRIVTWLLW